jgi:hypothetical protein
MSVRPKRFPVLLMMIFLAAGAGNAFSQSPKEPNASNGSVNQSRLAEPDKEAAIRNALDRLFAGTDVQLEKALPRFDEPTHRQIRVHWQSAEAQKSSNPAAFERKSSRGLVSVVTLKARDGALPRERSLELSSNQMVVVALDSRNVLRWWKVMLDPRIVRSETVTATGEIHGQELYQPRVDFVVECPDDPGIVALRFYHPAWDGSEFRLEQIGNLSVR